MQNVFSPEVRYKPYTALAGPIKLVFSVDYIILREI